MVEWHVIKAGLIDLSQGDVPDNEYTRAYRAECEGLFSDPDLRLVTDPDWRPELRA